VQIKYFQIFSLYKNTLVILHFLSGDGWKKNPKKLAYFFYDLSKIIVPTELKTYFMLYYAVWQLCNETEFIE
jgi:hypothetical protein